MTAPLRLVMVCTANISRSPYAERRAVQLAGPGVEIGSAGVYALEGAAMDPGMAAQLLARGADPSGFASRRLTRQIVQGADLLLTAEAAHRSFILDEWPQAVRRVFTLHQFAATLELVPAPLRGREALTAAFAHRRPADPGGDIPDPFRRGPAVAGRAAELIDGFLLTVLDRLDLLGR